VVSNVVLYSEKENMSEKEALPRQRSARFEVVAVACFFFFLVLKQ